MKRHRLIFLVASTTLGAGCAPHGAAPALPQPGTAKRVDVRSLPYVRSTDERFQSFQVGFSHLTGGETWKSYDAVPTDRQAGNVSAIRETRVRADLSNPRLRTLTAALSPLYIRYSGTTANSVFFQDDEGPALAKAPPGYTVVLTREGWRGAVAFAKAVNAKILTSFTNSDGVRDDQHAWTPRMAAPWLAFNKSIGGEIYAAELFNEPNAPDPGVAPKGHTATEFARDYAAFTAFMKGSAPGIKLAGPGVAKLGIPIPSMDGVTAQDYASADPKPKFNIFSYHFYPGLAQRCAPSNSPQGISADRALSEEWLGRTDRILHDQKAVRDRYAPGAPLWITETGGGACGGLTWQPSFLDVFRYIDSNGRNAKNGADAMFTHALISGSNGIIDEKSFLPNASYWAAVLWRRLMGAQVLDAGVQQDGLHIYAHCLRGTRGGVALAAINLRSDPTTLDFAASAEVYALTSPELQSKTVLLNGRPLALGVGDTMPAMVPSRTPSGRIKLSPTSVNFVAVPHARNAACSR
jgi:hypothetical protein